MDIHGLSLMDIAEESIKKREAEREQKAMQAGPS